MGEPKSSGYATGRDAVEFENEVWQTGISKAFRCHPTEDVAVKAFQSAVDIPVNNEGVRKQICWFDRLFRGGIVLPDPSNSVLTILFTGPPGTGKSTLALELCYRLSQRNRGTDEAQAPLTSLYISTEMTSGQIGSKVRGLGWNDAPFICYSPSTAEGSAPPVKPPDDQTDSQVLVLGSDSPFQGAFTGHDPAQPGADARWQRLAGLLDGALEIATPLLFKWLTNATDMAEGLSAAPITREAKKAARHSVDSLSRWFRSHPVDDPKDLRPDIIVVDSLNSLPEQDRAADFNMFIEKARGRAKAVIFVLDSDPASPERKFWEYVCDNVIRMDCSDTMGYYLRHLEIVKARYQQHVHGKQLVRICDSGHMDDADTISPQYRHPYREEGGLFIYPSIHYYLSIYKRQGFKSRQTTKYDELICRNDEGTVRGLTLPEGRCTAFIGSRGGHKSHLGYIQLLDRLVGRNDSADHKMKHCCPDGRRPCSDVAARESALVVSLRDDEEMTKGTMEGILTAEFGMEPEVAKSTLAKLLREGWLEILYFHPGYITPEEFFHRMYMSVLRLKDLGQAESTRSGEGRARVTVLFNSLDQLKARFPLCAAQDIFIPGIIDSLSGENVTSIFVAVDEPGQPTQQYGLLPMADLVLSFRSYRFGCKEYQEILKKIGTESVSAEQLDESGDNESHGAVVMQILRYAGGNLAGTRGLLELIKEPEAPYTAKGLHYVPMPRGTEYGELTEAQSNRQSSNG